MKKTSIFNLQFSIRPHGGYSMFIAVIIMASLTLIAFSVVNISVKETQFSVSNRESQQALTAADAGIECAIYWDSQIDAFATSTSGLPRTIDCGGVTIADGQSIPTGAATPAIADATQIGRGGGDTSWNFCAFENQTCVIPGGGAAQVRYGANGSYYYRTATGSIECNNATFGDPIVGVFKTCDYGFYVPGDHSIFGFLLGDACVIVTVVKNEDMTTHIHSRGYNTCNPSDPRRVERGIEVRY